MSVDLGCLVSLYEESPSIKILIIVIDCSGKDSKFNDTEKIFDWYKKHKTRQGFIRLNH
jgi:hypothetical protein